MNTKEQLNFLVSKLVHNLKRADQLLKEKDAESMEEIINFSTRELEIIKALKENLDSLNKNKKS